MRCIIRTVTFFRGQDPQSLAFLANLKRLVLLLGPRLADTFAPGLDLAQKFRKEHFLFIPIFKLLKYLNIALISIVFLSWFYIILSDGQDIFLKFCSGLFLALLGQRTLDLLGKAGAPVHLSKLLLRRMVELIDLGAGLRPILIMRPRTNSVILTREALTLEERLWIVRQNFRVAVWIWTLATLWDFVPDALFGLV